MPACVIVGGCKYPTLKGGQHKCRVCDGDVHNLCLQEHSQVFDAPAHGFNCGSPSCNPAPGPGVSNAAVGVSTVGGGSAGGGSSGGVASSGPAEGRDAAVCAAGAGCVSSSSSNIGATTDCCGRACHLACLHVGCQDCTSGTVSKGTSLGKSKIKHIQERFIEQELGDFSGSEQTAESHVTTTNGGASSMHPPQPRGGTVDVTDSAEGGSSSTPTRRSSTRVAARTPPATAAVRLASTASPASPAVFNKELLHRAIDHSVRDSMAKMHKSEEFQTTLGAAFGSKAMGHVVKGLVQKANIEPTKAAHERNRKSLVSETTRMLESSFKPHMKAATEMMHKAKKAVDSAVAANAEAKRGSGPGTRASDDTALERKMATQNKAFEARVVKGVQDAVETARGQLSTEVQEMLSGAVATIVAQLSGKEGGSKVEPSKRQAVSDKTGRASGGKSSYSPKRWNRSRRTSRVSEYEAESSDAQTPTPEPKPRRNRNKKEGGTTSERMGLSMSAGQPTAAGPAMYAGNHPHGVSVPQPAMNGGPMWAGPPMFNGAPLATHNPPMGYGPFR